MIINAFGTGMQLELGFFEVGWLPEPLQPSAVRWRVTAQRRTPGWQGIAAVPVEWKETR